MKPTDLIYVLYYVLLIFWMDGLGYFFMDGLGYFFDRVVVRLIYKPQKSNPTHLETTKKPQKNNPTHLEDIIYDFILSPRSTNTNHPG